MASLESHVSTPPIGSPRRSLAAARLRAARAKFTLATVGGLVFVAALGLARGSHASNPKHRARALAAPPRFVDAVNRNLLQAGVLAPAQAPPEAQTSVS